MKIVVFDVDNTLVKGHLTRLYIKALLLSNPFLLGYFLRLAHLGSALLFWYVPRLIKKSLRSGDLVALDRGLHRYATLVIKTMYTIFDELGFTGMALSKSIRQLVLNKHFENYLHLKALRMLELHVKRQDTIVVLASAGIEECMQPFYEWLCRYLEERGVATKDRLFIVATRRMPVTGALDVCLGEQKMKRIDELLKERGIAHGTVTTVYTDNQFLADLPLLLQVQGSGYVVGPTSRLYQFLPVGVVARFRFYPLWSRSIGSIDSP